MLKVAVQRCGDLIGKGIPSQKRHWCGGESTLADGVPVRGVVEQLVWGVAEQSAYLCRSPNVAAWIVPNSCHASEAHWQFRFMPYNVVTVAARCCGTLADKRTGVTRVANEEKPNSIYRITKVQ